MFYDIVLGILRVLLYIPFRFQLIGSVEKKTSYTINLGTNGVFTVPASGRLWVYANDANFFYSNNHRSIELHIH